MADKGRIAMRVNRRGWRALCATVAATATLTGAGLVALVAPASATTDFGFTRLSGHDRYGTAAAIAKETFPNGSSDAIIATGEEFPDALAGNYFAGHGEPVLLTRSGKLPDATSSALRDLAVKNVTLLGGFNAISKGVEQKLKDTQSTSTAGGTLDVNRLYGHDRYDTMKAINEEPGKSFVGNFNSEPTAIVASGAAFPDALSAASLSYTKHFPLVLTKPGKLVKQAKDTFTDLGIQQVLIFGGFKAVSQDTEDQINDMGISTLARFRGSDRSDTSEIAARFELKNFGLGATHFNVATGQESLGGVDALAGGPHSGEDFAPTLVTDSSAKAGAVADFAEAHCGTESSGHAFGGKAALPDSTLKAIAKQAQSCNGGTEKESSTVSALPTSVPADGTTSSTVTVTLNKHGQPVTGADVDLTQNNGASSDIKPATSGSDTTNAQGKAVFEVTDSTPESVTYTAKDTTNSVTVDETAQVTFFAVDEALSSTVTANPTTVKANGTDSSTITVDLESNGKPVTGAKVALSGSSGTSSKIDHKSFTTGSDGEATFHVTDTTAELVTYTATDTTNDVTIRQTASVNFTSTGGGNEASASSVKADPDHVEANGTDKSTITVTLMKNGDPVTGADVSLKQNEGASSDIEPASSGSDTTDSNGEATFTVTDKTKELVTYTATDTTNDVTITDTASVSFTKAGNADEAEASIVEADPTTVKADGNDTSTITVTLLNSGSPVSDAEVTLTPSSGTHSVIKGSATGKTGSDGTVKFTVSDTQVEDVTYSAHDDTNDVAIKDTAEVHFTENGTTGGNEAAESMLTADPTSVPADGTSKSTITVTLTKNGDPVKDTDVALDQNKGSHSVIDPTHRTTNAMGVATFMVTDKTAEVVTYTATDTDNDVTVTDTASVKFTSVGPKPTLHFVSGTTGPLGLLHIKLTYNKPLNCSTVAANGSDFNVTANLAGINTHLVTLRASCHGNTVGLLQALSLPLLQTIKVTAQVGDDGNTVKSAGANPLTQAKGDSISFRTRLL
jgi:putative cell wall-binding protein